ncbi:MAG TPA: hypothetical protein VK911_15850 [Vicinamibacterales bacterium]|nr:hypothetical protein [Vicinamibacterales bacterium]
MDPTFRTPLLDCFRRGEAPREVRLLAAAGELAPRAHEQLTLLVVLSADEDPEIRALTERTIHRLPAGPLAAFLARADVNPEVRAFFEARGMAPPAAPGGDSAAPLLEAEPGDEDGATAAGQDATAAGQDVLPADAAAVVAGEPDGPSAGGGAAAGEGQRLGVAQRLSALDVGRRMKAAMLGSREERNILIRDPNRLVAAAVLSSPKLTESEVESMARMGNVSDEVLRIIGTSRAWVKNYNVVSALTRNAKTPIAISLTLLSRLNPRDVRMLSMDKNVPEPLRVAARKQVVVGESRKK